MAANPKTQYEDFEPPYDWVHDDASQTLILMVPGFRKEQLMVQVTLDGVLRLRGERKISENKWRRFKKEIPVPNSDITGITAKFEAGILYVRLPKLVSSLEFQQKKTEEEEQQQQQTQKEPLEKDNGKKDIGPPVDKQSLKEKSVTKLKTEAQTTTDSHVNKENGKREVEAQQRSSRVEKVAEPKSESQTTLDSHMNKEYDKREAEAQQRSSKVEKVTESKSEAQKTQDSHKNEYDKKEETKARQKSPKVERGVESKNEAQMTDPEQHKSLVSSKKKENEKKEKEGINPNEEKKMEKRSPTLEMLSRQTQEYKGGFSRFAKEVKNGKKLGNLVIMIFMVLLFGIHLKNMVKSSFGGSKRHAYDHEL